MSSTSFLSTYQQYKCDTDIITSWLATNAKKYRYTTSLAAPPTVGVAANKSAAPSSGCLKGKAHKEAKQQQKQHVAPLGIEEKDAPNPPLKLNACIFRQRAGEGSLCLKVEGGSGIAFNMASKKGAINAIHDNSMVEDSSDIVLPTQSSPIDFKYITENDESEAECIFAFTALLKDLIKLRKEVSNLWNEYHSGKIDLTAAAWAQNKAALLEVVPNITLLFELKGISMLNEFACGVKYMFETQEIPVWLCFAVQNYFDTLRFFRPNVMKVLAEFYRFNEITAELLDQANLTDYHQNDMKKDLEDMRKMVTVKINSIHYMRVLLHQTGVRYAAKPGAVLHAVQLYTAVRQQQQQQQQQQQEHLVPVPEWPDLNRLVAMQGLQAFFVGTEPPASLQAHFKNYCMSRGVSPAN
ncbi:bloom syndrome [Fusarium acutatum]|uniref:Bloom syndrome n=1 Tax=Fusarium acutatum TaxID=78861 RepID=A0A8H4JEX0_9HYPO|nr:bloom syndrome [Fusarium acutatum]